MKALVLALFVAVLALGFQNCSPAKFAAMNDDFSKAGVQGEGDHVDVVIDPADLPDEDGPGLPEVNDDDDGDGDGDITDDEVADYPCPGQESNLKKVLVCHVPPGNLAARHNICISRHALATHLDHEAEGVNDTLGACAPLQ
jgi:hypothetical protein